MAKETFDRSKPHVNIGTVNHTQSVTDTAGTLTHEDYASTIGNPDEGMLISFEAPASSTPETAAVAFPIDDTFRFDPSSSGAAVSLDFQLDVLPQNVIGTSQLDVTLAIIQGEPYLASYVMPLSIDGSETEWTTLLRRDLLADHFEGVSDPGRHPDFSQPFQFGFTFQGDYSSTALDVDLLLDNLTVEITTVPEPSSIALALSLGAAFVWHRWFRRDD